MPEDEGFNMFNFMSMVTLMAQMIMSVSNASNNNNNNNNNNVSIYYYKPYINWRGDHYALNLSENRTGLYFQFCIKFHSKIYTLSP